MTHHAGQGALIRRSSILVVTSIIARTRGLAMVDVVGGASVPSACVWNGMACVLAGMLESLGR